MYFPRLIVASVIFSLGVGAAGAANPQYTLKDLGTIDAQRNTRTTGINDRGDVVGYGDFDGNNDRAFRYANGTFLNLGTMGGMISRATGISDAGIIGGDASTFSSSSRIPMIYAGGQMSAIVTFGGSIGGVNSVNAEGVMTGYSRTAGDGPVRGFIRFADGSVTQVPLLNNTDTSNVAYASSKEGYTVGTSVTAGGRAVAFVYAFGVQSLDSRPELDSIAVAMNDAFDTIVGNATFGDGSVRAVTFAPNSSPTDLGTLSGDVTSQALDVNNSKTIVGTSAGAGGISRGFVIPDVSTSLTMLDLNTLIVGAATYNVQGATGVNNAGQIAAYGSVNGGPSRALLLTPVAAPTPTPAAPTVAITGKKAVTTTKASLVIKGKTTGRVTSLTYRVGAKGAFRPAKGNLAAWKFTAKLKAGKNPVTVIASGPGGSKTAKITVTRKDR